MALEEISLSGRFNTKSAGEANNYLNFITRFDFVVSLVVANKVLGYLKSLSSDLQGRQVDVVSAYKMVDNVHSTLQDVKACIKYFKLVLHVHSVAQYILYSSWSHIFRLEHMWTTIMTSGLRRPV